LLWEIEYCSQDAHADEDPIQKLLVPQSSTYKLYMRPAAEYNHWKESLYRSANCPRDHAPVPLQ